MLKLKFTCAAPSHMGCDHLIRWVVVTDVQITVGIIQKWQCCFSRRPILYKTELTDTPTLALQSVHFLSKQHHKQVELLT